MAFMYAMMAVLYNMIVLNAYLPLSLTAGLIFYVRQNCEREILFCFHSSVAAAAAAGPLCFFFVCVCRPPSVSLVLCIYRLII